MPAMRACLAKVPYSVLEVSITKSGPMLPRIPPAPGRYRPRPPTPPPDGVYVKQAVNADATARADTDAAARCVEPLATKLALPAIKEKDSWYQIAFLVVGN
jgi:hypothetical protein